MPVQYNDVSLASPTAGGVVYDAATRSNPDAATQAGLTPAQRAYVAAHPNMALPGGNTLGGPGGLQVNTQMQTALPQPVDPNSRTLSEGVNSVLEVPKRTLEGVDQFAGHLLDYTQGQGWNGPQTQEATQQALQRRAAFDQMRGITPGDSNDVGLSALSSTPWMAAGPGGATKWGYNILKQGLSGATAGAMQFSDTGNNLTNSGVAAALGVGLASIAGIVPGVYNSVKRKVIDFLDDGRVSAAFDAIKKVLPGSKWTLAQMTDVPALAGMERQNYNTTWANYYADQTDKLATDAAAKLHQIPAGAAQGPAVFESTMNGVRTGFDAHMDSLIATRSSTWKAAVADFEEKAKGLGSFQTPTLNNQVQELLTRETDPLLNPGKYSIGAGAKAALTDIREAINPPVLKPTLSPAQQAIESQKGISDAQRAQYYKLSGVEPPAPVPPQPAQLPVARANDALTGIRKMMEDADPKVKALGGQLFGALQQDLRGTLAAPRLAGEAPEAYQARQDALKSLLDLRSEYGRQSGVIDTLHQSALGRLVGVTGQATQTPTAAQIWAGYKSATPSAQASIASWIKSSYPEALPQMRQQLVNEAFQSAVPQTLQAGTRVSGTSLPSLNSAMGELQQHTELFSAQQLQEISAIQKASAMAQTTNYRVRPEGGAGSFGDQAASRAYAGVGMIRGSIALGTKFLMKMAGQSQAFEQMLMNPDIQALTKLSNTSGPGQRGAQIALLSYLDAHAGAQPSQGEGSP